MQCGDDRMFATAFSDNKNFHSASLDTIPEISSTKHGGDRKGWIEQSVFDRTPLSGRWQRNASLPFSPWFPMSAAFTDIPVDAIDRRYQQLATDGLLNLDGQNIPESETVKIVAMPESDLTLATKSDG